jgi:hypothetical protein
MRRILAPGAVALVLAASCALFLAACGDDDDAGSKANATTAGGSSGTGTDEQFVKDVCKAGSTFAEELRKAFVQTNAKDLATGLAALTKVLPAPLEAFTASFRKTAPPADLVDWQRDSAAKLDSALAALKAGRLDDPAFATIGRSPVPPLPAGADARIKGVAAKTAECKDLNVFDPQKR